MAHHSQAVTAPSRDPRLVKTLRQTIGLPLEAIHSPDCFNHGPPCGGLRGLWSGQQMLAKQPRRLQIHQRLQHFLRELLDLHDCQEHFNERDSVQLALQILPRAKDNPPGVRGRQVSADVPNQCFQRANYHGIFLHRVHRRVRLRGLVRFDRGDAAIVDGARRLNSLRAVS